MPYSIGYNQPLWKDVNPSEMQTMRDEGMTNREIAENLGVSMQTVRNYIGAGTNRNRVYKHEFPKKLSDETIEVMKKLDADGDVKRTEIAEMLNISMATILKYCGRKRRPKQKERETCEKTVTQETKEAKTLRIICTRQTFKGAFCEYTVETGKDSIDVSGDILTGTLNKATLADFIAELQVIQRMVVA